MKLPIFALALITLSCAASGPAEVPWGPETDGLSLRAGPVATARRGDEIEIPIALRVCRESLPTGGSTLDRWEHFSFYRFARLELTSEADGSTQVVVPFDHSAGMPDPVWGPETFDLTRETLPGEILQFPLAPHWSTMPEGDYSAVVTLRYGEDAKGGWRGTLRAAPFRLRLGPPPAFDVTFAAPTALFLRGRTVALDPGRARPVRLSLRHGFALGLRIERDGERWSLTGTAWPVQVPVEIDRIPEEVPAGTERSYTLEFFETADASIHHWMPGPGSGGYRTLWKETFRLRAP